MYLLSALLHNFTVLSFGVRYLAKLGKSQKSSYIQVDRSKQYLHDNPDKIANVIGRRGIHTM